MGEPPVIAKIRYIVRRMRAHHVNPTPADLGGVTSFLYELEHRYKYSFLDSNIYILLSST